MNLKKRIDQVCSRISNINFAIKYWDGECIHYGEKSREEFVLELRDEGRLKGLFSNIRLCIAEAYMDGAVEVKGSFEAFLKMAFLLNPETFELNGIQRAVVSVLMARQRNTRLQAAKNISHHYDIGDEFYRLWLGEGMLYSCAYFRTPDDDINTAQEQKMHHICAKLRLDSEHRLLDIGCGWGQLLVYAAKKYGCKAVGVTLSANQKVTSQSKAATLGNSIDIRLQDYRDISEDASFDRIVSVGMFEHVGRENIDTYMAHTERLLRPGGCGVLHTMGRMREASMSGWLQKYIFPGLYLPPLDMIIKSMANHGLYVVDIENLRLHYALTIDRWLAAFESSADVIQGMYDERFVRMWRLYLHSSAASFRYSDLQVWQIVYTKGLDNQWPLTRDYLYT